MAHHDLLTGLQNRSFFMNVLEKAVHEAASEKTNVVVLFIDLDRFKLINDSLGHEAGDQILTEFAIRLKKILLPQDTVVRFGGDEFVVLLGNRERSSRLSMQDAVRAATRIVESFKAPFECAGRNLSLTGSIGIRICSRGEEDPSEVMRHADAAMYQAKDMGGNGYRFFSREMGERASRELDLEGDLRLALEREEFILFYQPQANLKTGRIEGIEALLRWQHPQYGLLGPDEFISIAEDSGLIIPIGYWVAKTAIEQLARLKASGYEYMNMSINLSGRQLMDAGFLATMEELLGIRQELSGNLELEITESILLDREDWVRKNLMLLSRRGIRFAIDDFGTGYSSLRTLQRLPVNTLKIDKSFTRDLVWNKNSARIVAAVANLSRELGLRIVAEGVETRDQLAVLQEYGCHTIQGFLLSPPLAENELRGFLKQELQIPTKSALAS
jgi:diguanylate cyclase (GGDEF)-like protein